MLRDPADRARRRARAHAAGAVRLTPGWRLAGAWLALGWRLAGAWLGEPAGRSGSVGGPELDELLPANRASARLQRGRCPVAPIGSAHRDALARGLAAQLPVVPPRGVLAPVRGTPAAAHAEVARFQREPSCR